MHLRHAWKVKRFKQSGLGSGIEDDDPVGFVVGLFWIPTNRDAGTDIMLLAGYLALPFSTYCNAEDAAVASGHPPDATPENEAMITRHGGDSNRLFK